MNAASRWADATLAAALFALDPRGLGGVVVRAAPGPVRDAWLAALRARLAVAASGTSLVRIPAHTGDDRLLGGLDLAATLAAGRPVVQRGLLAEADGGVVCVSMAERLSAAAAARLAAALDTGTITLARDGVVQVDATRIGVVALDEGIEDEHPPAALLDRLAFRIDLDGIAPHEASSAAPDSPSIAPSAASAASPTRAPGAASAAQSARPPSGCGDAVPGALCATALALGIDSLRAPMFALRAARAAARLAGRDEVVEADLELAARLVLAPRATRIPEPPEAENTRTEPPAPDAAAHEADAAAGALQDVVLQAAQAAIPARLLEQIRTAPDGAMRAGASGTERPARARGRPAGVRRGVPRDGARLDLIETLRAAAPWQPLRRAQGAARRIEVRAGDLRITRRAARSATTTIFVIDASGSAALHRLAEAKGAVELLLADCYVRRDRVAVLAFRQRAAEMLLPPTRSLARAKRSLAGLPGGGGTPLAAGIDAAAELADAIRRRGETPLVVLLTDGRANIARDGSANRARAAADALAAARRVRESRLAAIWIDTSREPDQAARGLAGAMDATYLPLPHAEARALCAAVQQAAHASERPAART